MTLVASIAPGEAPEQRSERIRSEVAALHRDCAELLDRVAVWAACARNGRQEPTSARKLVHDAPIQAKGQARETCKRVLDAIHKEPLPYDDAVGLICDTRNAFRKLAGP